MFCRFPRFCTYCFLAATLNDIALDSTLVTLPKNRIHQAKWDEVYGDVEIETPLNIPQGPGNEVEITMFVAVEITMFVNAAFADDLITRRSRARRPRPGALIGIANDKTW